MNIYDKLTRFEDEWVKGHESDFDISYWRKCWNIRYLILKCLSAGNQEYEVVIKREDIPKIIDALKSLNADNWTDYGGSIWEWEDYEECNEWHIKDLEYLYELMGEYDLDVYFYDSY